MKILCIIQCSNLGGMEKVTLESLSILKEQGHEITFFSLHPVGDLKSLTDEVGIPLTGTKRYRYLGLGNTLDIIRVIKQTNPDRLWFVGHNFGSLLASLFLSIPTYMSIHYHHSERTFSFWRIFYGLAKFCTRKVHFVSQYIFDEVSLLFEDKSKYIIFPNVFKEPAEVMEVEDARRTLELPYKRFLVGNAGWLIKRKAFDVFLNTASLVLKEAPEIIFVIAGDGDEREALETLAIDLNIQDSIQFIGWKKNLEPFYAAIDVLLFNSHFDCLPTTPLEAISRAVPVVCSLPNGGLKEILRHGIDGFLIDNHDPEELAKEILKIYYNSKNAKKMALVGKKHVLEVGSVANHINYLDEFLELK